MDATTKTQRIGHANFLLLQVSERGRRFFSDRRSGRIARFELSLDGKLWFRDDYTDQRIYVAYRGRWKHFSHGGTLRSLVEALALYIRTGERIAPGHFGPWPQWICNSDLWGYGSEQMALVRNAIRMCDCVAWPVECEVAA